MGIKPSEKPVIGWREWVALPELGVPAIKAKIDTGARSSALHAYDVEVVRRRGRNLVRFKIYPLQRSTGRVIAAEAQLVEERWVRSSSGHRMLRPVIQTAIELDGQRWPIELTLTGRDEMGFRMLLGRQAVRRRFVVDPARSFRADRQRRVKKRSGETGAAKGQKRPAPRGESA
jgi:hypothetical protein